MERIEEIIVIVLKCLVFISTVTGLLIPLVKNANAKKKLVALNKLTTSLQSFIMEAETFNNFSGEEKKEYVMTKANRYAIENKIPYDAQAVSDKIEDLVALSKEVNKREKSSTKRKVANEQEGMTSVAIENKTSMRI